MLLYARLSKGDYFVPKYSSFGVSRHHGYVLFSFGASVSDLVYASIEKESNDI